MTCTECRELFSAFADDALAADARGSVAQHMAGCAECRRDWQRFSATIDLLHAVQRERAPAGFVDRVLTAARPLPWYRRLARGLLVPWTVKVPLEAAAIVMVAGLAVLVFRRLPETEMVAHYSAPIESRSAPAPADAVDRFSEQQELLARSLDGARKQETVVRVYEQPSTAPAGPAPAAPPPASQTIDARTQNQASRGQDLQVPRGQDAPAPRGQDARLSGAKPDAPRSETAPAPIAQQPSQEPVMTRRQQLPDQAAPPALKSLPAAPNVAAATGESVDQARAKRQDKLAKEAERDAMRGGSSSGLIAGSRERKVEDSSQVQRLARTVASNVEMRLATTDRAATEKEIATIVERLGGAMVTPASDTLEIMVPNQVFAALTGDLSRLGTLRIVQQPGELPETIRITVRLTD